MSLLKKLPLILAVVMVGCEDYDPPPEATLEAATTGRYVVGEDLQLSFSERVVADSVLVSAWCTSEQDIEGGFPSAEGSIEGEARCGVSMCPAMSQCGEVSACLQGDAEALTLRFDEAPCADDSGQLWLVLEPGLTDSQGQSTGVVQAFSLMVWPAEPAPAGEGEEALSPVPELNSGVVTLISSLAEGNDNIADIYPSLYLRLMIDVLVSAEDGETWLLATMARLTEEAKQRNATSEVPTERYPVVDNEGWAVLIKGTMAPEGVDVYRLETEPTDVTVWVLGTIKVVLKEFQLLGLVYPGGGSVLRDSLVGELTTTEAEITLGGTSALGAVNAIFTGDGLFEEEIPETLPRLCALSPCASLIEQGGDCQVPLPWQVPVACP